MHFSTDKQNPIIIHGNSTVELPKTQVSDKSETANNFISISFKILSFTVAMLIFAHILWQFMVFLYNRKQYQGGRLLRTVIKIYRIKKKITWQTSFPFQALKLLHVIYWSNDLKYWFKNQANKINELSHVEKEGNAYFKFLTSLICIVWQTQFYSAQGNG